MACTRQSEQSSKQHGIYTIMMADSRSGKSAELCIPPSSGTPPESEL